MFRRSASLLVLTLAAIAPASAAKPPRINTAAIRWPGTAGRLVHGYMAIPVKARGRQPAVLVLADPAEGGQTAAHALTDGIARAGLLACTPRGDEADADLAASIRWLETNRYATGKVAIVAVGPAAFDRARAAVALRGGDHRDTAVVAFDLPAAPDVVFDVLALPQAAPGAGARLPARATTFLKEHLR